MKRTPGDAWFDATTIKPDSEEWVLTVTKYKRYVLNSYSHYTKRWIREPDQIVLWCPIPELPENLVAHTSA